MKYLFFLFFQMDDNKNMGIDWGITMAQKSKLCNKCSLKKSHVGFIWGQLQNQIFFYFQRKAKNTNISNLITFISAFYNVLLT